MEKAGNYSYAIAIMILPLYGALYATREAEKRLETSGYEWAPRAAWWRAGFPWNCNAA